MGYGLQRMLFFAFYFYLVARTCILHSRTHQPPDEEDASCLPHLIRCVRLQILNISSDSTLIFEVERVALSQIQTELTVRKNLFLHFKRTNRPVRMQIALSLRQPKHCLK